MNETLQDIIRLHYSNEKQNFLILLSITVIMIDNYWF
jgi:hypothetical protein